MKTRILTIAAVITALALGAVGSGFAEQKATTPGKTTISARGDMQTNGSVQRMQGLTPEQRKFLDREYQRKTEPAGVESYPAGLKYYPAPPG